MTAILTFLVHCFFAQRIFRLSRKNYFLTVPIVILAVLRLASASVTTGEMIALGSFTEFKRRFTWIFTLGLSLSTAVDILITGCLFLLLQTNRTSSKLLNSDLNALIDSLIMYTFETGAMTCAATIVAMVLWVVMPHNLIFMGLHFVIGKFYANSYLVTVNARKHLRKGSSVNRQTLSLSSSSKDGRGGGGGGGGDRRSGLPAIKLSNSLRNYNRNSAVPPSPGRAKQLSDRSPSRSSSEFGRADFETESQGKVRSLQINVERSVVFSET